MYPFPPCVLCPVFLSSGAQRLPSVAHQYAQQQVPRLHPPEWLQDDHRAPAGHQGQPAQDLPKPHRPLLELLLQGLMHSLVYCVYILELDVMSG